MCNLALNCSTLLADAKLLSSCNFSPAEAQEQLLNAKVILRAYTETLGRRDPEKSARTTVRAAEKECQDTWHHLQVGGRMQRVHSGNLARALIPQAAGQRSTCQAWWWARSLMAPRVSVGRYEATYQPSCDCIPTSARISSCPAAPQHMLNKEGALLAADKGKGPAEEGDGAADGNGAAGQASPRSLAQAPRHAMPC